MGRLDGLSRYISPKRKIGTQTFCTKVAYYIINRNSSFLCCNITIEPSYAIKSVTNVSIRSRNFKNIILRTDMTLTSDQNVANFNRQIRYRPIGYNSSNAESVTSIFVTDYSFGHSDPTAEFNVTNSSKVEAVKKLTFGPIRKGGVYT